MTTMVSILSSPPEGAAAHPAKRRKTMAMNLFTKPVRSETDIGEPAALRALADVLGELLLVEGRHRPVLPLDSRDNQALPIRNGERGKDQFLWQSNKLDPDSPVRPLRHLFKRKHEQPCIGGKRRDEFSLREFHRRASLRALAHFHEVLPLPRLGDEIAELADEAQARRAAHEERLPGRAKAHPDDVVGGRVDQRVDRRAVAAARGDGGGIDGESLARGGEHDHGVGGLALEGLQQRVAVLEGQRGEVDAVAAAGADPALLRQDHGDRLLEHRDLELRALLGFYQGPSLVAVLLRVFLQFGNHQLLQFPVVAEEELQPFSLALESLALVVQLHAVEPGELPEAQVDDVFCLPLGEPEFLLQLLLCFRLVVARADQLDDLVDLRVRLQPALDDVQPLLAPVEAELGAAAHGADTELAPLAQYFYDALGLGQAVQAEPGEVDRVAALERRVHEQHRHQLAGVLARGARLDHQAQFGLAIAFVPHASLVDLVEDELLQPLLLLADFLLSEPRLRVRKRFNLLCHLLHRDAVRELGNHDPPLPARQLLRLPLGSQNQGSTTRFIRLSDLLGRRDDLAAAREIRPGHALEHVLQLGARMPNDVRRGGGDFLQVVRRDTGGEADRNAERSVQQAEWQAGGEQQRLFEFSVVVPDEIDGTLPDLAQYQLRESRQSGLGVPVGGGGVSVPRAEVALAVDQGIAHRERLREVDQRRSEEHTS